MSFVFIFRSLWMGVRVANDTQHPVQLYTGALLFRAHQAALSSSGMRASADELSAWEALTSLLVVRVDQIFLIRFGEY
jgi:hypothetical protein